MSTVVNTGEFKPGSIHKITLYNFMSYTEIEFLPGPTLNIIIGPNGTGKSSLVSAIILGLGGKPTDICKSKISDYIKEKCNEAKIEIQLYQKKGKPNMVVTTFLNRPHKITREIDGETVSTETLLVALDKYKIQVNNLCQVLPQLRVHDFSALSPSDLLVNTLKAVSGRSGASDRRNLIEMSQTLNLKYSEKKNKENELRTIEKLNERDKLNVDNMMEKEKLEEDLHVSKLKQKWLEVGPLEKDINKLETKCARQFIDVEECQNNIKTKQNEKRDVEKKMEDRNKAINTVNNMKRDLKRSIENLQDSMRSQINEFRAIDERLLRTENEIKDKEKKLQTMVLDLEKRREDRNAFLNNYGDENILQNNIDSIDEDIRSKYTEKREIEDKRRDVENSSSFRNIISDIENNEAQLRLLCNHENRRMELLRKHYNDTYQALEWFRSNRNMFRHTVYEPMLLEIRFSDESLAKYLESTVSSRDLTAFSFVDADDMELFLREVRQNLRLMRVSALCLPPASTDYADRPLNNLRHLGFTMCLSNTFEAPPAILRYLCDNYQVHRIPIGNAHTWANKDNVPTNINLYFADKYRVRVKTSLYTNKSSQNISQIGPAKLLGSNHSQIREIEEILSNLKEKKAEMQETITNINNEEQNIMKQIDELEISKTTKQKYIDKLKEITRAIKDLSIKVERERDATPINMEAVRVRARQQQSDVTRQLAAKHPELVRTMTKLHYVELYRVALLKNRSNLNDTLFKYDEEVKQLQRNLTEIKEVWKRTKSIKESKESERDKRQQEIKGACGNKLPTDADFPYKREFKNLSSSIDALLKEQYKITRNIDHITFDREIVRSYKERVKTIQELKSTLENMNNEIETMNADIASQKPLWVNNVKNIVQDINKRFGDIFHELQYTGEVLLNTGNNEADISSYGVEVSVSFGEEATRRLDGARQSGGERALATAAYVLALQAAALAPFKCLDEINQGMDAKNERNFINLLMREATELNPCQYFLLSPKLLKNLDYNEKVKVHVVMNGPSNASSTEWNIDDFIKRARLTKNGQF